MGKDEQRKKSERVPKAPRCSYSDQTSSKCKMHNILWRIGTFVYFKHSVKEKALFKVFVVSHVGELNVTEDLIPNTFRQEPNVIIDVKAQVYHL